MPASAAGEPSPLMAQLVQGLRSQLSGQRQPTPRRDPGPWQRLARDRQLPLLPLLALAEEWRPLHASLGAIGRSRPC